MNLLVVGASHQTASIDLLEQASINAHDAPLVLATLLESEFITEAVVVSTCNRVEVYASVTAFHGALADIGAVLARRAGTTLDELATGCYAHYGEDAIRHIFRVAAGLDSMVVGEPQILGQLRAAYALAREHHAVDSLLHGVMQQALRVGKRVHAETEIDHAGRSVVHAALQAARTTLNHLAGRNAVVVGAGSMAALAAAELRRADIGTLAICNRSAPRAERLAHSFSGTAHSLDELPALLPAADIVICATGATGTILDTELLQGRELVIADLAIPRDVAPQAAELPGITLISIETLTKDNTGRPDQQVLDVANAIIEEALIAHRSWLGEIHIAPTVAALRARADAVIAAELANLQNRMSPAELLEVERTLRRVVGTLIHTPTVRVKELATAPDGARYAAMLAELFSLEVAAASPFKVSPA
ncbi:MAG: glutamyl-tRNA reductase [Corynebacteriales bacterium]|nr:glutamyl-tRNA reductase [Mycobacteriales bacterium]